MPGTRPPRPSTTDGLDIAAPEAPVLVGFSGGLDSTVLLHLLAASAQVRATGLRAVHVHHGLHREADAWAAHVREVCTTFDVPLSVIGVEVRRDSGHGLEGAARVARLAAFARELQPGEVLALAHHRDDQAETFLLRALRASGPDGLAAMRPWRPFAQGWLWRPLLDIPRAALSDHAHAHGLHWIEDDSNADTSLDRNFLRQRVLPALRERWPQADAAFARVASLQAASVELLEAEDARALATARTADPHALQLAPLLALPPARRARVLRRWIAILELPPLPGEGIARIESELLPAAADTEAEFAWAGAVIHRWRDLLYADHEREALPADWSVTWSMDAPLVLPTGDRLELDVACTFDTDVHLHARVGGERIVLPGRTHSHALKHVLQELGVPPWERKRLPLLSDAAGNLLAAGDLLYSAAFDSWLRERGARLVWSPAAENPARDS
ncbi:tRNA lysidine(34) synthetase TilS [Lysobacter sp. M2-1]|uniref:tRNA lysidine(34) synthetase TilS n=1 Tax=Lysobacter sp. M2-1 TaxID=2916839 RepID=UPI001F583373|nr:tRNA lysidine(34) synthetase TilS [Lysobacter sp. M2-1]